MIVETLNSENSIIPVILIIAIAKRTLLVKQNKNIILNNGLNL